MFKVEYEVAGIWFSVTDRYETFVRAATVAEAVELRGKRTRITNETTGKVSYKTDAVGAE